MTSKNKNSFTLRVWGDFACFTRPEMKAERMSYEVMTPSAARNILQAIMWKPAIDWQITAIDVLKPIRWTSIRRNELSSKVPTNSVEQAIKAGKHDLGVYIEDDRQQRAGLILRDVEYLIHAYFDMTAKSGPNDNETKFRETFIRRAMKGQCFTQPYLGCREFTAFFELQPNDEPAPEAITESRDLGWMLYDMDFEKHSPEAMFFPAKLERGKLQIPKKNEVSQR